MSHCASFFSPTVWSCQGQVFELNLKDPLISPVPCFQSHWTLGELSQAGGRQREDWETSTYSADPVAWANGRADWNLAWAPPPPTLPLHQPPGKDTGGACLQCKSLAFCPPLLQIRRQELLGGAGGSSELQRPWDSQLLARVSLLCFQNEREGARMVEAFCATWKLTDSQNFDEYMKALGGYKHVLLTYGFRHLHLFFFFFNPLDWQVTKADHIAIKSIPQAVYFPGSGFLMWKVPAFLPRAQSWCIGWSAVSFPLQQPLCGPLYIITAQ